MELIEEAADPLVKKLRRSEAVTVDDFVALPLFSQEVNEALFSKELEAAQSALHGMSRSSLSMEDAANIDFDYGLLPFPVAVAMYVMEAVGGFPAKMMWSILSMLVCWQAAGFH